MRRRRPWVVAGVHVRGHCDDPNTVHARTKFFDGVAGLTDVYSVRDSCLDDYGDNNTQLLQHKCPFRVW